MLNWLAGFRFNSDQSQTAHVLSEAYRIERSPNESGLGQQRAADVARVLGLLHMDGLDVDPEMFVLRSVCRGRDICLGDEAAGASICP